MKNLQNCNDIRYLSIALNSSLSFISAYNIESTIAALSGLCLKAFLGAGIAADGLLAR